MSLQCSWEKVTRLYFRLIWRCDKMRNTRLDLYECNYILDIGSQHIKESNIIFLSVRIYLQCFCSNSSICWLRFHLVRKTVRGACSSFEPQQHAQQFRWLIQPVSVFIHLSTCLLHGCVRRRLKRSMCRCDTQHVCVCVGCLKLLLLQIHSL